MDCQRIKWKCLYREILPALAKKRDSVQSTWPVHLDHCFARIILDNAIGIDRPWPDAIKSPAVSNMSATQLETATQLAEDIATGVVNLATLNERSLHLRGKKRKAGIDMDLDMGGAQQKKRSKAAISSYFMPTASLLSPAPADPDDEKNVDSETSHFNANDMAIELRKIANSDITPFRKQMLTLLCQIPPGRYSTYQAMSDHITKTSHKTCARAVGSAMRNNPFAPEVPCHRVLAADGTLGGFGGHWGESGKFANKKHELLHAEGVRFDSRGKVKGPPFREFHS